MNDKNTSAIPVVVFANRKDFFMSKICISSIRYFYKDVDIYLVKDALNGPFYTNLFCAKMKVKQLELGHKYFGWSAAKLHFLISLILPTGKYLTLDSDILFTGKILEQINLDADFIVSSEKYELTDLVKSVFLDPDQAKYLFPTYQYPGFFFNAGQMVISLGKITKEHLSNIFDPDKYPYYKQTKPYQLPLVDQGILNALLPVLADQKVIKLDNLHFMQSADYFDLEEAKDLGFFKDKSRFPYLVHYAGENRVPDFSKMRGSEYLYFFHSYYLSQFSKWYQFFDQAQNYFSQQYWLNRPFYLFNRVIIEIHKRAVQFFN